ncbi:MAG: hypothetical protein KJ871_15255 [Alphaproteobacteria bacterium]|uniref:hypothetical protein n=1 Tax=Hyphomonas sp. TaxID=87 RepID=UPI003002979E|nr:hypothetical protein [Alphaproteobacteria bacterium]
MSDEANKDWKLKLRYGQTTTDFQHFAMIADGAVVEPNPDFKTEVGPSVLSMKAWAKDTEEAAEMMIAISNHLGFKMAGKIDIYATDPDEAPKEKPYGYDLKFTPYVADPKLQ